MSFRMGMAMNCGTVVACLLSTWGCGGVTGAEVNPQPPMPVQAELDTPVVLAASGQRLSALAYGVQGALQFRHFYDEDLGFACRFATDARGTPRCFPLRTAPSNHFVFADANCQQPAIWLMWKLEPGQWLVSDVPAVESCVDDLQNTEDVFEVGELVREAGETYDINYGAYAWRDGQCAAVFPPGHSQPPLHRLIARDPSELVSAKVVSSRATAHLSVTHLSAEDGAALNLRATLADASKCALMDDGSCVPEPLARPSTSVWLDASCSAAALSSECREPRYGVVRDAAQQERVVELVRSPQAYTKQLVLPIPDDGNYEFACTAVKAPTGALSAGREVSGTFPKAERFTLGEGEFEVDAFRLGGFVLPANRQPYAWFRDTQGATCSVHEAADGTLRCLDDEAALLDTNYRADEACQTRVYVRRDAAKVPFEPSLLTRSFVVESGYQLGALQSAKRYEGELFANRNGRCAPASPDAATLQGLFGNHRTVWLVADRPLSFDVLPLVDVVTL